jgi:hypothetical protein
VPGSEEKVACPLSHLNFLKILFYGDYLSTTASAKKIS